jgi:acyl-coenzyme A thioesterase PaaI-like protein
VHALGDSPAKSIEELQAILDGHPFLRDYAFAVEHVERGVVRVAVPYQEKYVRPGGVIPGFIYMAAADVVMWLAIYTVLGDDAELSVTTDMRSAFLSGLAGEEFLCEARVLDTGKQLLFGTAECRSRAGALITHHALTYIMPPSSPR